MILEKFWPCSTLTNINHLVVSQRSAAAAVGITSNVDLIIDGQGSPVTSYDLESSLSFLLQFVQLLPTTCLCLNGRNLVRH